MRGCSSEHTVESGQLHRYSPDPPALVTAGHCQSHRDKDLLVHCSSTDGVGIRERTTQEEISGGGGEKARGKEEEVEFFPPPTDT